MKNINIVDEASALLKDRDIEGIFELDNGRYLVYAPGKGLGANDMDDPLFEMDLNKCLVSKFNVMANMAEYQKAMKNQVYGK